MGCKCQLPDYKALATINISIPWLVYKIPYRRARAWPGGCIGRVRARAKVSCVQSRGNQVPKIIYSTLKSG